MTKNLKLHHEFDVTFDFKKLTDLRFHCFDLPRMASLEMVMILHPAMKFLNQTKWKCLGPSNGSWLFTLWIYIVYIIINIL